eukprot:2951403-Pyramimonas_sp.AAC.1
MEIEHSQLTGTSLSGCTADRKKFFDLLEHDIGNRLMQALGCPAGVLAAEKSFYAALSTHWKVAQAVGPPTIRKNGFVQGDSWSLQQALALMSV